MVELDKDLSARGQIFADHLLEPRSDSVFMALPLTRAVCKAGTRAWSSSTSSTSSPTTRSRPSRRGPGSATARTIANPALDDFLHRDALRATLPPKMRHEEHPRRARGGGQVPIVDVENAIRSACRRWRVLEIAADPFRWARSLQLLDGEGLPVLEYPQSPGRMAPTTARF